MGLNESQVVVTELDLLKLSRLSKHAMGNI